mgnify:CR=1 FL=1
MPDNKVVEIKPYREAKRRADEEAERAEIAKRMLDKTKKLD